MLSVPILRRKRSSLSGFLNQSIRSVSGFKDGQSNGLEGPGWTLRPPSGSSCQGDSSSLVSHDASLGLLAAAFIRHTSFGFSASPHIIWRPHFDSSSRISCLSHSLRFSSTATAGQPEFRGDNDRNEQHSSKQTKEASPEECDEAVEDLTEVKAKAKAKQVQESQKSSKSIIHRMWATLLGIGPALRAVALMSRLKFYFL